MPNASGYSDEHRVLVLAPTTRDASTTEQILRTAGIECWLCKSMDEVCAEYSLGAGAALLTEEAIVSDEGRGLVAMIRQQPPWSDFPLVILTRSSSAPRPKGPLETVEHRTLISRPVQISILVSTIEAALRDRKRQYAVRDYLIERERSDEALREADRRKDEFLAMLAHELRNPLAAMRSAVDLVRLPGVVEEDRAWAQDVMLRQLTQLTRLIDDLLDVSRVTHGKILLRREHIELGSVIERAVDVARPMMLLLKHRLEVLPAADQLWLEADPVRLEQVIVNLLNNAAKYTREGGQIVLSVERDHDAIIIRVKDTGIGISAENLAAIFDLFSQADRTLDRAQGGLGIGLTLVKKLVEMHGGEISARSEGVGRGSEFIVRLPAAQIPADDGRPLERDGASAARQAGARRR